MQLQSTLLWKLMPKSFTNRLLVILVSLALACRPDLSFEVELLTQSLTSPTTRQAMQLQKVLGYLSGTLHYSLSLHPPTTKRTQEEDKKP